MADTTSTLAVTFAAIRGGLLLLTVIRLGADICEKRDRHFSRNARISWREEKYFCKWGWTENPCAD